MKPDDAFKKFMADYPAKTMKIAARNSDEVKQMTTPDGLQFLTEAPSDTPARVSASKLPETELDWSHNRHLWVIDSTGVPFGLEACAWGATLQSGKIKHSNLTGGGKAHSGGEIWFVGKGSLIINANSGRYGASDEAELNAAVAGFLKCGYRVASMGFDIDNPTKPNSVMIGAPVWREPVS